MKRLLFALMFAAAAVPASASIAVFVDGRSLKVDAFQALQDGTMRLKMKNGGSVVVPITRVDRIIDDEVATPELVAEVNKLIADGGVFPQRSWHFHEGSGPIFRSKFDVTIVEAAKKFDVDAALVSAVIKAESDFNPREVSNKR